MKKSLLAVALLGAFSSAAFAQSSVTIYGIIDAGIQREDNGNVAGSRLGLDSGLQSGSRLGFKGTEDLGGGLKANFVLEMGLTVDDGNSDQSKTTFGRQSYVGLSGDFGAFNLGRQKTLTYDISDALDPFHIGQAGNMNRLFQTVKRANNAVVYSTNNLGGFTGSLQYAFGEVPGDTSAGRLVALAGTYAAGPLYVAAAYQTSNNVPTATVGDNKTKLALIGATYDFNVVKAHAAFETRKDDVALDQRVWMLGVTVPVGPGAILADYTRMTDKVKAQADANMIAVGYTYNLSKRTNLYTSYSRTANDANVFANDSATAGYAGVNGATDKLFQVGIRHAF